MSVDSKARWYDKDPQLKGILNILQKAPDDMRQDIAMEIIQIIINENFTTSDDLLSFAKSNYIGEAKRWYDLDELVHTAVEMIKLLSDSERQIVLFEVAQSILYFSATFGEEYEKSATRNGHMSDK